MAQFKVRGLDNVRESFTGAASATITLGGAVQFSRTLAGANLTAGDTFWGMARAGAEISVGIFTYNTTTVAQTDVRYSSNGNAAVVFSSGAQGELFVGLPAFVAEHMNFAEITVASAATMVPTLPLAASVRRTASVGVPRSTASSKRRSTAARRSDKSSAAWSIRKVAGPGAAARARRARSKRRSKTVGPCVIFLLPCPGAAYDAPSQRGQNWSCSTDQGPWSLRDRHGAASVSRWLAPPYRRTLSFRH